MRRDELCSVPVSRRRVMQLAFRFVGPAEGDASGAVMRLYICSPLGAGLLGGQGASCLVFELVAIEPVSMQSARL